MFEKIKEDNIDQAFIKILKAEGIHVYHQYEGELYVGFKYNI